MFVQLRKTERWIIVLLNTLLLTTAFLPFIEVPTPSAVENCDVCYDFIRKRSYETGFYWMIVGGATLFQLICFSNIRQYKHLILTLLIIVLFFFYFLFTLGNIGFMSGMPFTPKLLLAYKISSLLYLIIVVFSWINANPSQSDAKK